MTMPPPPPDPERPIDDSLDLGGEATLAGGDAALAEPHPMAHAGDAPQRDRVVVLGRTRAGKTIYLARLYEQCWKGDGPLRIEAHDGRTHLSLLGTVEEMLEHRRWPPATEGSSFFDLNILYQGHSMTMVSLDYPGEVFRRAFVQQVEDEDTRELIDHVKRAAALLLLIDPKVLATGRMGEAADDDFGMVQAMRYLRSLPGGMDVPIALVLTKIDENADLLRHHGKLRGFAEKFCANLLRVVPGLRIFGVCAVRSRRDALGRSVPDLDRPPRGLTGPLEYCLGVALQARQRQHQQRAAETIRALADSEARRDAQEAQVQDRFWLWVNLGLVAAVLTVGLVAWFVVKSSQ
jgi:hypothetical protein